MLLTDEEKTKVARLVVSDEEEKARTQANVRARSAAPAKKQKIDENNWADILEREDYEKLVEVKYANLDFIPASSASVERVFSKAGKLLSKDRQKLEPVKVEAILFLHMNSSFWDVNDVAEAMELARKYGRLDELESDKILEIWEDDVTRPTIWPH